LITAIGRDPELGFAQGEFLEMIDHLKSEGRLYFIGDLHNGSYRQTAMAVGDGVKAAMSIGQKLEER
jgi:thioredoxin reductase